MTDLASKLLSAVSFVFFDLDDTLIDHRKAEQKALTDLFYSVKELRKFDTPSHLLDTYHDVNTTVWIEYSDGEIDKSEARVLRFTRLLKHLGVMDETLVAELSERYLEIYSTYWTYLPGARESFLAIAGQCPVGILTNGFSEIQRQKLSQFQELRDHSSCIVISEEAGYMKPDRRVFQHAEKESGVDANQILYIGDSIRSDVAGGKNAGWRVAWFRRDSESQPTIISHDSGPIADMVFSDWSDFLS